MRDILSPRDVETKLLERLKRIEQAIEILVREKSTKEYYSVADISSRMERSEYTVRIWCAEGRVAAIKNKFGHREWRVPHAEFERLRNFGIRPKRTVKTEPYPGQNVEDPDPAK
jgi:hypothetical protein